MPASSPATGDVAPPTSASSSSSAIIFGSMSGSHVLNIVGYSRSKQSTPNGQCTKSCRFSAAGRNWHVQYYPNGWKSEVSEYVSLYLVLADTVAEAVKMQANISLLDQDGEPVPSYSNTTDIVHLTENKCVGYGRFIKREVLEKSEHLKDDSFTVKFDVTVMKEAIMEQTPLVVVPPSDMHRHFGDLLSSKEGADVKFRVRRTTFSAHRSVLAARTPVFKKGLLGPMKEGTTTNAIPIKDMEPKVFGLLLEFVYTDALPEMKKKEEIVMAQHLLVAANRYNLERLKLICEDRLSRHIDVASAATILAIAEQHNCRGLNEACFKFLSTSTTLNAFMKTEGFEYLTRNFPCALKELMSKVASH